MAATVPSIHARLCLAHRKPWGWELSSDTILHSSPTALSSEVSKPQFPLCQTAGMGTCEFQAVGRSITAKNAFPVICRPYSPGQGERVTGRGINDLPAGVSPRVRHHLISYCDLKYPVSPTFNQNFKKSILILIFFCVHASVPLCVCAGVCACVCVLPDAIFSRAFLIPSSRACAHVCVCGGQRSTSVVVPQGLLTLFFE